MLPQKDPEVFDLAYPASMGGDFQQAYDRLTGTQPCYPEHTGRLFQWRVCMAARMGKLDLAEQLLGKALHKVNFYSDFRLRKDGDLKDLQGRPKFEGLVARNLRLLADAQKTTRPLLTLFEPMG